MPPTGWVIEWYIIEIHSTTTGADNLPSFDHPWAGGFSFGGIVFLFFALLGDYFLFKKSSVTIFICPSLTTTVPWKIHFKGSCVCKRPSRRALKLPGQRQLADVGEREDQAGHPVQSPAAEKDHRQPPGDHRDHRDHRNHYDHRNESLTFLTTAINLVTIGTIKTIEIIETI